MNTGLRDQQTRQVPVRPPAKNPFSKTASNSASLAKGRCAQRSSSSREARRCLRVSGEVFSSVSRSSSSAVRSHVQMGTSISPMPRAIEKLDERSATVRWPPSERVKIRQNSASLGSAVLEPKP